MDYTSFSAIFQVATPYTVNSDSNNSHSLTAVQVGIIVIIIGVILSILSCLYAFCRRNCCGANNNNSNTAAGRASGGTEFITIEIPNEGAIPATVAEAHSVPVAARGVYAGYVQPPQQQRR